MNKFAFSTVGCPSWDLQTIADRAKEYGYTGVEFRTFLEDATMPGANLFLSDPDKVTSIFNAAGIEIACLASSIAFNNNRRLDAVAAEELRQHLILAQKLNCRIVKIFDTQIKPGQDRVTAGVAMANWLLPLADEAADRGIAIVIENALSFRSAKEMWSFMEAVPHPSVGLCWDVFNAAQVGEPPAVSVPMLNSRIFHTHVKDAKFEPRGAAYCKLGEGDVPVRKFLTRLMGIGYDGYVVLEWDKVWLPNLAEPEIIFPDAIEKMKKWTSPAEEPAPVAHAAKK
jgi:sugar phosphate isomerase/epimerase